MSLRDDLRAKSQKALAGMGAPPASRPAETRPVTTPGAVAFLQPTIDALNERLKAAEGANDELRRKLASQPSEVELDRLDVVGERRRRLTPAQFEELKENLRHNPLVHPVAVKATAGGRYEIVSGHHRVDAFRALGRASVPVVVVDIDEAVVDRSAFYANLLQPSLPDYEKYLGFRRERERTGATQKELARAAGIAESTLSMLFAFDQLPERARELIDERPEGIGMNCAFELARLTREGTGAQVVEAVELLLAGRLTQQEAVRHAARHRGRLASAVLAPAAAPVRVRAGRSTYCQYVARGASLRIDFRSEEERAEAEARLAGVLQELADRSKGDS